MQISHSERYERDSDHDVCILGGARLDAQYTKGQPMSGFDYAAWTARTCVWESLFRTSMDNDGFGFNDPVESRYTRGYIRYQPARFVCHVPPDRDPRRVGELLRDRLSLECQYVRLWKPASFDRAVLLVPQAHTLAIVKLSHVRPRTRHVPTIASIVREFRTRMKTVGARSYECRHSMIADK